MASRRLFDSVDHRPLVQSKAAEIRRAGRGRPQQSANRGDQWEPVCNELFGHPMSAVEDAVSGVLGVLPCGGATQCHASARMPAAQLRRPVGVVSEEKVVDRVWFTGAAPSQVGFEKLVNPSGVCRTLGEPRGLWHRVHLGDGTGRVYADYPRGVRIARFSAGEDPLYGVVTGGVDDYGQPAEDSVVVELVGDPLYRGIEPTTRERNLAEVRLLAPVIPRSKVVGVGKNYHAHVAEFGGEVPTEPLVFLKPNTAVIGPDDPIRYPTQTADLHYEAELAVVIGRICRDVPPERASEAIFGYTVANDVTARDLQNADGQWSRAKGFDTFCPLGPWIETELTLGQVAAGLAVQTYLEGDLKQDGNTKDLVFDVPTLIAHISSAMTLLPGDVILTGTPAGVGPMQVGDEVEVSVAGIGALTNRVTTRD
jgi:2-keto-4-pentenoate hydratase/2-oxohepta-3-ene-1,7-dioic acid hydratase in catechol pathway